MESFFFLLIFTCLELSTGYSTLSFNSFTSLLSSQLNYDLFIIFPVAHMVKNPPIIQETGFEPWVGKIPWRRAWQPTPVLLRGESPSLAGCSPQGRQESDMTERLSTAHTQRIIFIMRLLPIIYLTPICSRIFHDYVTYLLETQICTRKYIECIGIHSPPHFLKLFFIEG